MTDDGRVPRDDRLADDIEALLAVDPSPDFRVRVRTALGTPRARARWRQLWLASSAFAAVTLLVVVALWQWTYVPNRVVPATLGPDVAAVTSSEPDSQASEPLATPRGVPIDDRTARAPITATMTSGGLVNTTHRATVTSRVLVLPDVILAEDELLGLKLLMMPPPVDDGRAAEVEPVVRLAEIELRDIVLEPLALSARLEGELP